VRVYSALLQATQFETYVIVVIDVVKSYDFIAALSQTIGQF
jgi:hypothetical protein